MFMFILSASPIAFSIGALSIYWYGIIYSLALLLSWMTATWILRKMRLNNINVPSKEEFDKFMFFAIISILVGARLGEVLFFEPEYYFKNPLEILMLRNGGLSFHGAFFGLVIYSLIFIKKNQGNWKVLADILCIAGALGVGVGRIANFINQELYGIVSGSSNAVIFKFIDHMPRHPTQLYESFFEGFLNFWIMFIIFRIKGVKTIGTGIFVAIFCTIYASSRFVIEFYKEVESQLYFNFVELTTGQILCLALFIFGLFVLYCNHRERKNLKI